jgi:hypothetical protein
MMFVSAGGKTIRRCKMFNGSDTTFDDGYGYINCKKENNQEIHREGRTRRVLIYVFISFATEEGLDTEVYTHQVRRSLKILVINDVIVYYVSRRNEGLLKFEVILLGSWLFDVLFKKFVRARVFSWLLLLLLGTVMISGLFNSAVIREFMDCDDVHAFGGGSRSFVLSHFENEFGMVLVSARPFIMNFLNGYDVIDLKLWFISWLSRTLTSIYPPGGQIKSTIHDIEHPAVSSGQRSPSSSEDG